MAMSHSILFFVLALLGGCLARKVCPPEASLRPLNCNCKNEIVSCSDVKGEENLQKILRACVGYKLGGLDFEKLVLDSFPADSFDQLKAEFLSIRSSTIGRLTKPENGDRPFSNATFIDVFLVETNITDGDLSPIGKIPSLWALGLTRHPKTLSVSNVTAHFQNSSLKSIGLIGGKIEWSRGALSSMNQLETIQINSINASTILREDLPKNASHLRVLSISNGKLESIPDDLISGMNLMFLKLSDNNLTTLNEKTFEKFNGQLDIHENPLVCDTRLDWLVRRVKSKTMRLTFPTRTYCSDGTLLIK